MKKLLMAKELKQALKLLKQINALEAKVSVLTNKQLQAKTNQFRTKIKRGHQEEEIRVEAFAVAREATKRVLKKRPFDVQIVGGLILDMGSVAEMKTGEGKTITSVAPVYLNALANKGVLVSTVNEYLSERDAIEMGEVFNFLGLSVGINKSSLDESAKRDAYSCDVTYSVHSEIGFDYLRDNMVSQIEDKVQREFNFILIDEVDSILIDEAKTPLIVSGGESDNSRLYMTVDKFAKTLQKTDYEIDLESKAISLSSVGVDKANRVFGIKNLYDFDHSELVHRIQNTLRANYIMSNNVDYIVREGKILLVDQFTGRVMDGRSYSAGLQQAIQAKENVEIEDETKTLATITYQNLFRMFPKLSGMTGTAKTEEKEFIDIYNMRVHAIETNKPLIRKDQLDNVFIAKKYKVEAIVQEVQTRHTAGQPILVGTAQVNESEQLSQALKKAKLPHTLLNAKQNKTEAEIIAAAGEKGAITIATNMAGRGTDIKINDEVIALGGLFVLGTDRAESRRIDNQLRGRSGRQGDPGESCFFISLDDALIARFSAQEKLKGRFKDFGASPIRSKLMTNALIRAQKKIEGFNYDARKNVLQYDDVIRQQRDIIYNQRNIIIGHGDLLPVIKRMMASATNEIIYFENFLKVDKTLDANKLANSLNRVWFSGVDFKINAAKIDKLASEELQQFLVDNLVKNYKLIRTETNAALTEEGMHDYERKIILKTFDSNWQVHIDEMDKLRSSSSLSSYAQKNPYQVYTEKGGFLFGELIKRISHNTIRALMDNRFHGASENQEAEQFMTRTATDLNVDINQASLVESIKNEIQKLSQGKYSTEKLKNLNEEELIATLRDVSIKLEAQEPNDQQTATATPQTKEQTNLQTPTKQETIKKPPSAKKTTIKKSTPKS